jgi:hypothetical protein
MPRCWAGCRGRDRRGAARRGICCPGEPGGHRGAPPLPLCSLWGGWAGGGGGRKLFLGNAHPGERGAGGCGKRCEAGVYWCARSPVFHAPSRGCGRSRKSRTEADPRDPVNVAANRPMVAWGGLLAGISARRGQAKQRPGGSLLGAIAEIEQV